ncbi:MAG TPA: hypothetical protein P5511_04545, partial [Candidatus Goldiibacteriota bacterium]|nr:hypothetical protein [Candidatus Goldiibacteriota bacterium]
GYIQRGGRPTAMSRYLGLSFGYMASSALLKLKKGRSVMAGLLGNRYVLHDMKDVIGKERKIDVAAYKMNDVFSI